jgi:PPOX class probable F420-dependent enzyme
MDEEQAVDFVAKNHRGVLATIKRDGRPQLSNVSYALDGDGRIKISTTRSRAKARNLGRDPRASLSVQGDDWHQYIVVEATADVQSGPNVAADLRRIYEMVRGEPHPNWAEFDEAMVREGRVVLALTIERLYPLARVPSPRRR